MTEEDGRVVSGIPRQLVQEYIAGYSILLQSAFHRLFMPMCSDS